MTLSLPEYSVSTVTCAFTEARWDYLVAAVGSLLSQTRQPDEVVLVVDNNPELLRRAEVAFRDALVIPNTHSRGASGARNTGSERAVGDIVAFLDDDATADPNWLELLLQPFLDDHVVGVGGEARPQWPSARPVWFPKEFDWVVGCSYAGLPVVAGPVRNLIGTNMSVRRQVMASVAGFREGFGNVVLDPSPDARHTRLSTCEETDFCIRVSQSHGDARWVYEPAAKVQHRVPKDRTTFGYFVARCWLEGQGKALLGQLLGPASALGSERDYVRRVLPRGVLRGVADSARTGQGAGSLRAAAIVAGLAATASSYFIHRFLPGARRGNLSDRVS
ncbi:MAG: glycosyltransferase family 2 protein [Candidatus Dormibacteria bacterium]